ncbi:carbohydrate ABC transporter permease [Fusibacter ferrireducens]|uniref:Carbohydrate ABC transporter permease n=1 Tax=Fusibacter ferrireducens TaxID=2785058 RepID=A0ABR9ZRD1_9FIRM|nr:carbohydrate ABC transporter permease [Fusibacter ferrireducens]MBF4692536.1 carbohydrate ABC transporter permease [Fusibacter ferrireducens]
MKYKDRIKGLMILMGVIVAIAWVAPVFILLNSSFKSLKEIYISILAFPKEIVFSNYTQAFEKLDFVQSFTNSIMITVISTLIIILFSSMTAWVLVRNKSKKSTIIFMLFASALLVPFQCVMLPLVDLMSHLNLMNRFGIVIMYLGFGSSMSVVLFHGFIKNIPLELEEAAMIDGCNIFQTYFHIVLPLLKPIMVTVSIINAMWIWNDFLLPQLVINKTGWQTLPLKTYLFFGQFAKRWDLGTAALIIGMIPIIVFYIASQKYVVKGVTDGAIK